MLERRHQRPAARRDAIDKWGQENVSGRNLAREPRPGQNAGGMHPDARIQV